MPLKQLPFLLILTVSVAVASAQEPAPKAPDGWKYITAPDGSYQFLFATDSQRSGTRQQTFKRSGLSGRIQINYCQLKDGTELAIGVTSLSGAPLKNLKIGDVYDIMIEADKEGAPDMTDPKEFAIGERKGREYSYSKGGNKIRKVLFVVKGRVYQLVVAAPDLEGTLSATANVFLKSLVLTAKPVASKDTPKEDAKTTPGDALTETKPPTVRVKLPQTAAYRPTYKYADGKEENAGTVFVIRSPSGKKLALTAAHVLEPKEWAAVRSVTLSTMAGKKVVDLPGKPAYLGRAFDQLPELQKGAKPIMDTTEDFAIWVLPDTADVTVLELADHEPKANEWVWVVGQQAGKQLLFYRSKVTQVLKGTMVIEQFDRFNPQGFSGSPIVTAEGKVIGTMLASDAKGNMRQGASIANIRQRIKDL